MGALRHAWNAFRGANNRDTSLYPSSEYYGANYGARPESTRLSFANSKSIVSAIYVRMSTDAAAVGFRHIRRDKNGRYSEDMDSSLNNCLTVEANIDQASRDFLQDVILTMFDKGFLAIVPVNLSANPNETGGWDVYDMRVGEIVNFYPQHVRVRVWRQEYGRHEEIVLLKKQVAIVYNPFFNIMNAPNSTLQRLNRKLSLLDTADELTASGKIDLIIQLPYTVRSDALEERAQQRRRNIETQLKDSKYGVAYIDGTEKVTQLNRAAENNLLKQVEMLVTMVYGQLGITETVMNGTADEATMINYYNRAIEPILGAIAQAMHRSFLTKTARSQGQAIDFFRDPFKLVPISNLAEIADKFTRNEILSSNEFRAILGMRPADDPKADQLRNSNMPQSELGTDAPAGATPAQDTGDTSVMTDAFDEIDAALDDLDIPA